jgi:hypothetical protein
MTRARVGLLWASVLIIATPASAQGTITGWQLSLDPLYVMTRGNDVHAGDVFTESQVPSGTFSTTSPGVTVTNSRLDYGVTYDPIVTDMRNEFGLLVSAGYRGARWGFGGRGWRVDTSGSVDGSGDSPSEESLAGVRMWDHSALPVVNRFTASGYAPFTFYAENRLEHLRIDGYAERRWITGNNLNVGIRLGVAYAQVKNRRREGNAQPAAYRDVFVGDNGLTVVTGENSITLDAESEATADLVGPSIGIAGDSTHGAFRIEWLVSPAVLLGTAKTSGEWIDIDNISEVETSQGPPPLQDTRKIHLEGVIPVERDLRIAIPTLDLQVKASVAVVKGVRVGGGLFTSSWFGMPVAPAFSIPGTWTDVEGTGWRDQTADLTFLAYSAFVSFGF